MAMIEQLDFVGEDEISKLHSEINNVRRGIFKRYDLLQKEMHFLREEVLFLTSVIKKDGKEGYEQQAK